MHSCVRIFAVLFCICLFVILSAGHLQAQSMMSSDQKISSDSELFRLQSGASPLPAAEQATAPAEATQANEDHTEITIYPVLAYVPFFGADFNLPELPGGGGGGGEGGVGGRGSTDTSFNGAALAGVSVRSHGILFDFEFLWAGLSASRSTPRTNLDVNFVYGHIKGGYRVWKDLYATGGVKRVALDVHAQLEDLIDLKTKPGFWDPMIGVAWEPKLGRNWTLRATVDGGGFGVGADVDITGQARVFRRFHNHFDVLFGYGFAYIKSTNTIKTRTAASRTLTINQSLNGPTFGFGITF